MIRFLFLLSLTTSAARGFAWTTRPARSLLVTPLPLQSQNHPFVLGRIKSGRRRPSSSSSSSSLSVVVADWQSIVFNAESVANELANFSLKDPSNLVTSLPVMYGAGLLTSVSPCVWGLLPLTISYISAAAGERQDKETTLPTLAFAAGLAMVFCGLGVTAAQLGGVFGGAGNNNILLPLASNTICFAMGLQLLGLINIPLPNLEKALNGGRTTPSSNEPILIDGTGKILPKSNEKEEKGSLFRTFLLGGSSALVASPCATPVLTSILAFVAKAQNPSLGALLLFGYTLGYSTPLLLIAGTGGQALVDLRQSNKSGGLYAKLAPWVTPITGGILLWYGTNGLLTALFGDPSLAGLTILE